MRPDLSSYRHLVSGKVRELYEIDGETLLLVATDRISAYDHILGTPGVVSVHDVHVWAITTGAHVFSAHVEVDPEVFASGRTGELLDELGGCLSEHFDVEHSTFQIEPAGHRDSEHHVHH